MRIIVVLFLLSLCVCAYAQTTPKHVYTILADSVKITNCDSSELIIENHTQAVRGFLFNTGNGRTIFQRGAQPLGNGMYLVGADTVRTNPNAWLQGGNSFGATGVLGTLDSNHLDLYTSGAARARITDTGNFIIGTTFDHSEKLQVNGNSFFYGTFNCPNEGQFSLFNPYIYPTGGEGSYSTALQVSPTFNATAASQQYFSLLVNPTYNLGSYTQPTDGITPAVYVISSLGGLRIDQTASVYGNTGEPLFIYQAGTSDKPAIYNSRNGNATIMPFIWNNDNRPYSTLGDIIPAMRNTLPDSVQAGTGVSFVMDRYSFLNEASISMQYNYGISSNANINTSIAFNTRSSILGAVTPLYINGANIGMGTDTPSAQLHTTGSVRFAGLTQDNTQNNVLVSDANGNLFYRSASSLAANEPIRSSLAVDGSIKAKHLILSPVDWADYVFDSTYNLTPIADLATYLRREHHLPGIPAAAAVQQDGLDVGAGQTALLKKIEELTLYSIGQDKQLTQQQKEIDTLKRQMEELKALIQKH
jgi:hypothetical protein